MKKQRFEWKKFHPAFLAFLFYHVEQSYYRLCKQQLAPRKGAATDSFIFPIPLLSIAVTIDEISPGDKRARGGEGWNKCREKDRLTACAPLEEPRGKRMKNIFQSVPFCLTPRPLAFLPSFSFLLIPLLSLSLVAFSRKKSRRNLPFLAAQEATHVPRITVFFSLVKGPLDGMDRPSQTGG